MNDNQTAKHFGDLAALAARNKAMQQQKTADLPGPSKMPEKAREIAAKKWLFGKTELLKRIQMNSWLKHCIANDPDLANIYDLAMMIFMNNRPVFMTVPVPQHITEQYRISQIVISELSEDIYVMI